MSTSPVDSLVSAVTALDVPCDRTTPEAFDETLATHVEQPAVGVELRDQSVSLDETAVTVDPTPAALKRAHTGVTPAAFAIADYGSVVLPSTDDGAELVSVFVDRHVAVVDASDVVPEMEAAFERFEEHVADGTGAASNVIATGPSATADMGELVIGAHGPTEVRVVVVEGDDE